MYRLLTCAAVAATLVFAACGDDDTPASGGAAAASDTVSVQRIAGIGDVLVDSSGRALYTSEQEANGKIRCTDDCTAFWLPVEAGSGTPTAADGAGPLDVIKRPDGTRQVAKDGVPLYTFAEDAPGKVTGDGFSDDFAGTKFTWHVVLADGSRGNASSGGGGYGY